MRWFVLPAGTFDFLTGGVTSSATVVVNEGADVVQVSLSVQVNVAVTVQESSDVVVSSTTFAASFVGVVLEDSDTAIATAIVLPVILTTITVLEDPDVVQSSTSAAAKFSTAIQEASDVSSYTAIALASATVTVVEAPDSVVTIALFPLFVRSIARSYSHSTSAVKQVAASKASSLRYLSTASRPRNASVCMASSAKSVAQFSQVL